MRPRRADDSSGWGWASPSCRSYRPLASYKFNQRTAPLPERRRATPMGIGTSGWVDPPLTRPTHLIGTAPPPAPASGMAGLTVPPAAGPGTAGPGTAGPAGAVDGVVAG